MPAPSTTTWMPLPSAGCSTGMPCAWAVLINPSACIAAKVAPVPPKRARRVRNKRRVTVKFVLPASKRSEEHTSELQSLMRISYAVFCLKKKKKKDRNPETLDYHQHPQ